MAAGGYQRPTNPAPVSGPGALSKRTDGGQPIRDPGGLAYGDNQDLHTQQAAATMSGQSPEAAQLQAQGVPLAQMSPGLFDPTDHPDRPITSGIDAGPGAGSEALANPMPEGPTQTRLIAALPAFVQMAESDYTSPEFKAFVSYLRSVAGG